jgi:putative transposase
MRELEVLGDGHLNLSVTEWKEFFEYQMSEQVRGQVKQMIEQALEAERDYHLQLGYYEHAPKCRLDYRNGYYYRDWGTQLGLLRRLKIPRTRWQRYRSAFLPRYQRRQAAVNGLVREAFLRGISTRQVGEVLEPVLGECYSAQTVSRITRELNSAVERFHRQRLADQYVYLFLDGVVLKMRDATRTVVRRTILVAYGITAKGKREVIAYQFAQGESEASWVEFLQDLYLRGLEGKNLKLISTDGSTGLGAALPVVFPRIPVQLCWAHRMRNIADKVPKKDGSCVAEASAIYRAGNKNEAQQAFRHWKQRWEKRRPNAVGCVERNLDALLNFFEMPKAHWVKVRTTNVIERAFREVRRRTRPMSSFTNPESCDRIIFGVITHLNRSWERKPLSEFTQNA